MPRINQAFAVGLVIAVAGCAGVGYRVTGAVEEGPETFSGTITRLLDRSGEMEIQSTKGLWCRGPITYHEKSSGKGTLQCRNGEAGTFTFEVYGGTGRGSGEIAGRKIAFTASVNAAP